MKQNFKYFKRLIGSKTALLTCFLEQEYNNEKCLNILHKWCILPNSFDNNPFNMTQVELDEFQEIGRIHNLFIHNDILSISQDYLNSQHSL